MTNYLLKTFAILLMMSFLSCDDEDTHVGIVTECTEDALHTITKAEGYMVYLSCYDAWGVVLDESLHEDEPTIGVSQNIEESYQIDSLRVQVDACFYEFDLPLLLPDPLIWGQMYKMENFGLTLD